MVLTCAVKYCVNHHKPCQPFTKFHRIPVKNEVLRIEWINALKLDQTKLNDGTRICSLHFTTGDYDIEGSLKNSSFPTQNIPEAPTHEAQVVLPSRGQTGELHFLVKAGAVVLQLRVTRQVATNEKGRITTIHANPLHSMPVSRKESSVQSLKSQIKSLKEQLFGVNNVKKTWITKFNDSQRQVRNLSRKLKNNKAEILRILKNAVKETEATVINQFRKTFSSKQIEMILQGKSKTHWSEEEISKAIALRSQSSQAYSYVREIMKIPLPSIRTLQRWTSNIDFTPGLLKPVLNLLKEEFATKSAPEKLCVLSFDEMQIDSRVCYDPIQDKILGPKANLMLVVIRGLCSRWKQPIFYEYDFDFKKEIFLDIIHEVYQAGITVKVVVNDLAPKNRTLWNELGITIENASILHPDTGEAIHFLADPPHDYKLLRNNTLDYGLRLSSGHTLTKSHFLNLLETDAGELRINYKITKQHVECEGKERQRVYLATQLLSRTTADQMEYLDKTLSPQANFIRLADKTFDIFNSHKEMDEIPTKSAFGANEHILQEQKEVLLGMREEILKLRIIKKTPTGKDWEGLFPFQKGFAISITSLLNLYEDITKAPLSLRYIITHRLNQDITENCFSMLRGMGGNNDHPTIVDVKNRLKSLLLSWNCKSIINASAKMESDELSFVSLKLLQPLYRQEQESGQDETVEFDAEAELQSSEWELDPVVLLDEETWNEELKKMSMNELCELGGEEYVAGYVANKFKEKFPDLSMHYMGYLNREPASWTQTITNGGLTIPSYSWLNTFQNFEAYFKKYHDSFGDPWRLNRSKDVMKNLKTLLAYVFPQVPTEAINFYVKVRTFIRIKWINQQIIDTKRKVMRKNRKHVQSSIPKPTNIP